MPALASYSGNGERAIDGEAQRRSESVIRLWRDTPGFSVAQYIEYEVFLGQEYIEENGEGIVPGYELYDDNSVFSLALGEDNSGEPVPIAVLREIHPSRGEWPDRTGGAFASSTGFKTIDDLWHTFRPLSQELIAVTSPSKIVEVGTVAALEEHRGRTTTALQLYEPLFRHAIEDGRKYVIASMDARLYRKYGPTFNFKPLGPPTRYYGSLTIPVYTDLAKIPDHLANLDDPRYYRAIMLGEFGN